MSTEAQIESVRSVLATLFPNLADLPEHQQRTAAVRVLSAALDPYQEGWSDPAADLDMDRIVDIVRGHGWSAYVEQTGGGCATIYAGPLFLVDRWGDERYAVLAGPGWFDGPGWSHGRMSRAECSIGADYDDMDYVYLPEDDDTTEDDVAAEIEARLAAHANALGRALGLVW